MIDLTWASKAPNKVSAPPRISPKEDREAWAITGGTGIQAQFPQACKDVPVGYEFFLITWHGCSPFDDARIRLDKRNRTWRQIDHFEWAF